MRRSRADFRVSLAGFLALAIFGVDTFSPLQDAVAVLYTVVIIILASTDRPKAILAGGLASAFLAVVAYLVQHLDAFFGGPAERLIVSLTTIGLTTTICLKKQQSDTERRLTQDRYRTIFETAGFAIWESDWSRAYKMVQEAAAEAGGGLREWIARNPEFLARAAQTGRVRAFNDETIRLFGARNRAELQGGNFAARYTPATAAAQAERFMALIEGAKMVEQDIQLQTLSGELRDVVIRVTVPADETEWARILVMAIDVTARNRAQAKLAQTQAELAHAARVSTLGMLTASIAHEVNQPLSAIITYAKSGRRWLGQGERGAREALDCLDHIVANGSRAAGVIARVRSQAKGASPQTESLDLVTLVNEAIEVISREAQDNAIAVRATFPEQVPSIMGDKIQIQQVVINLMVNAIHSMTQLEEHALELCVEVTLGDSQVVLSVSDCGGGIGVEPSRLFDPFFTTKKDGMGMGLSICRSIVESHGGRIWAANRDEGGAVFSFTLPAMKSPAVSAA